MSKAIGFASKGFIAIAGASVLALTGLGLFAPAAQAAPNETEGTKTCDVSRGNGHYDSFPPGSTITVVKPNGTKHTYKCNGKTGEWDEVAELSAGLSPRILDSRTVTLVSATSTPNSGTTTLSSTLGTQAR